jgi:hypothetical protein
VVINQKECHSWCSNHVQTANYFNTLTVEMLNLFYYPKFKSSVPKSLCYIKMYSQLNFRSVIYSYVPIFYVCSSVNPSENQFSGFTIQEQFQVKKISLKLKLLSSFWSFFDILSDCHNSDKINNLLNAFRLKKSGSHMWDENLESKLCCPHFFQKIKEFFFTILIVFNGIFWTYYFRNHLMYMFKKHYQRSMWIDTSKIEGFYMFTFVIRDKSFEDYAVSSNCKAADLMPHVD